MARHIGRGQLVGEPHLRARILSLSAAQIARYDALRGYGAGGAPMHDHAKGHGG